MKRLSFLKSLLTTFALGFGTKVLADNKESKTPTKTVLHRFYRGSYRPDTDYIIEIKAWNPKDRTISGFMEAKTSKRKRWMVDGDKLTPVPRRLSAWVSKSELVKS